MTDRPINDPTFTKEQAAAAIEVVAAVGSVIRTLKQVPAGHLYAQVMQHLSHSQFEQVLGMLVRARMITRVNHLLTWVGDKES